MSTPVHAEVVARKNEDTERLIRRFIKKVKKEEIIEEVRNRKYYKKPSVIRREREARRLYVIRNLEKNNK
tara:strand:- start:507 stop:716 length:210 start_codon:yes stop_codon:yes gene_type:complete